MHRAKGEKSSSWQLEQVRPITISLPFHKSACSPAASRTSYRMPGQISSVHSSFCSNPPLICLLLLFSHACLHGSTLILAGNPPTKYSFVSSPLYKTQCGGWSLEKCVMGSDESLGPNPMFRAPSAPFWTNKAPLWWPTYPLP